MSEPTKEYYTDAPPLEPGWYWIKYPTHHGTIEKPVEVVIRPGHKYLAIVNPDTQYAKRDFWAVQGVVAQWSGPILPPGERI